MLWVENIFRFIVLLCLQVLLINNLHFMGVVHPCVYILFLLALPATINRLWLMVIGFLTGLLMDVCCNSLGVHTIACTALCFARPYFLGWLVQEDERLVGTISVMSLGWETYAKYLVLLTLLHHILVFSCAAFTLHAVWLTILQILSSSVLTIALILGWQLVRYSRIDR